jgi:hypothetical protein
VTTHAQLQSLVAGVATLYSHLSLDDRVLVHLKLVSVGMRHVGFNSEEQKFTAEQNV